MSTTKLPSIADYLTLAFTDSGLPAAADLRGWNSDHPVFDRLVNETAPRAIIQVGAWKGRSTKHFAVATATNPEAEKTSIFDVDTWLGGIDHVMSDKPDDDLLRDPFGSPRLYHQYLRNFIEDPDFAARIYPIQNTSLNGARLLASLGVKAQLIYIDGSHEYEDVYADLCAYVQLLAEGGVMFGDDFRAFPGVFAAVLRFAHEYGFKVEEVERNYWILRRPASA